MPTTWREFLAEESQKEYYRSLRTFIDAEYAAGQIYPPRKCILHALELTPLRKVRVVILGQDPYASFGQAHGLAFSVPDGVKIPPSLANIYKELTREFGGTSPENGDLSSWARQGVLLLNTVLTVREGAPGSHAGRGWETFTDAVIDIVCQQPQPLVFMLWGKQAQQKSNRIIKDATKGSTGERLILTTSHPSPLSVYRGFDGCGHFSACNQFLMEHGEGPIQWL